jgi:hypothetical protein
MTLPSRISCLNLSQALPVTIYAIKDVLEHVFAVVTVVLMSLLVHRQTQLLLRPSLLIPICHSLDGLLRDKVLEPLLSRSTVLIKVVVSAPAASTQ